MQLVVVLTLVADLLVVEVISVGMVLLAVARGKEVIGW